MVLKKIIFQNRYVELETFMEKSILSFHFDYLNTSLSCRVKPGRGAVRVGELLWDFVSGKEAGNFRFTYF